LKLENFAQAKFKFAQAKH